MSNMFDNLVTIEDWAGMLKELLSKAKKAIEANNSNERLTTQKLLLEYIKKSPSKCNFLDDIAGKAGNDLFISETNESLKQIATRNEELNKAINLIKGVTNDANKQAKHIQFENVVEILDKAKVAIEAFNKLEGTLDSDASLLEKLKVIGNLIKSFMDLAKPKDE